MAKGYLVRRGSYGTKKIYLYKDGVVNTDLIGNFIFTGAGCGYLTETIRTLTANDLNAYSITTANAIAGNYTKLCIEFKYISPYSVSNGHHRVEFGATIKYLGILKNNDSTGIASNQVITQCVEFVNGSTIAIKGFNLKAEISKIWLE